MTGEGFFFKGNEFIKVVSVVYYSKRCFFEVERRSQS